MLTAVTSESDEYHSTRHDKGILVTWDIVNNQFEITVKFNFIFLVLLCLSLNISAQSIPEKLGYPKGSKLLIIHADDLGVAHSVNDASAVALEKGSVSSASIMVPCPWFSEIAAYARSHPKADLGLHLTLTSEWKHYKWGPVSSTSEVPGLVNKNGFLYSSVDSVYQYAKISEVEKELRAQIEKARLFGIDFTHLDSHMGALYGNADYLKLLIRLGREYKVPVMLMNNDALKAAFHIDLGNFLTEKDTQLDGIFIANPADFKNGLEKFYADLIKNCKPGFSEIILHAGHDNSELQAVTIDHPDWGSVWRQADTNFFTSVQCRKLLTDQNIRVVTWREVRDKLIK